MNPTFFITLCRVWRSNSDHKIHTSWMILWVWSRWRIIQQLGRHTEAVGSSMESFWTFQVVEPQAPAKPAVTKVYCRCSQGKWPQKLTSYDKINMFGPTVGRDPSVVIVKTRWRPMYNDSVWSHIPATEEGKPMSCTCSVFILVKKMCVRNFSPVP